MNTALFILLLFRGFGDALSKAAWALSKPTQYQRPDDVTDRIGTVIAHPDGIRFAWAFSDDILLVHPEADDHGLDVVLRALIFAGSIPASELEATQARIRDARGTEATILQIMPPQLSNAVQTYDQMDADGWFYDP